MTCIQLILPDNKKLEQSERMKSITHSNFFKVVLRLLTLLCVIGGFLVMGNNAFAYTNWTPDSITDNGTSATYLWFTGSNGNPPYATSTGVYANQNIGVMWKNSCGVPSYINVSNSCDLSGGSTAWNYITPESRFTISWTDASTTGDYTVYYAHYDGTGNAQNVQAQTSFHWDASTHTVSGSASSSEVIITSPTAITYTSNPVTFSGTYTNVDTFNQIEFSIENSNFAGSIYFAPYALPYTSAINQSWSFSKVLGFQGNYTFKARLTDTTSGSTTPWTSDVLFSLGTTTIATSTSDTLPGAPLPLDCSAIDIACHLKNAMIWLFYPSQESLSNFQSLNTILENRAPFVYLYQTNTLREELFNASGTPQTISLSFKIIPGHGTSTLELLSKSKIEAVPFAPLIKQILGWVLTLLALEYIYYRVIRSHDSNTPA